MNRCYIEHRVTGREAGARVRSQAKDPNYMDVCVHVRDDGFEVWAVTLPRETAIKVSRLVSRERLSPDSKNWEGDTVFANRVVGMTEKPTHTRKGYEQARARRRLYHL